MTNHNNELHNLAHEIAEKLNDMDALPYHLLLVHKYNPTFLRKTLDKVLGLPDEKIRTTRAKLYTWLVTQSGHGKGKNLGG